MVSMSYKDAKATGAKHYIGRPCKHHGISDRLTSNRTCVKCLSLSKKKHKNKNRKRWQEGERRRYHNLPMTPYRYIGRALRSAKQRAKQKGLPFNLDTQYLRSIWTEECPVFKIPFDLSKQGHHSDKDKPSLDRIVPERGYVRGNVCFISYLANRVKNSAALSELIDVTNWLYFVYIQSPFTEIGYTFNFIQPYQSAYSQDILWNKEKQTKGLFEMLSMVGKNK